MRLFHVYINFLACLAGLVFTGLSHAEVNVEVIAAEGRVVVSDEFGKQPARFSQKAYSPQEKY